MAAAAREDDDEHGGEEEDGTSDKLGSTRAATAFLRWEILSRRGAAAVRLEAAAQRRRSSVLTS